MSEETSDKYKLDLDSKDFIEGANAAYKAISDIGNVESLSHLVGALGEVTSVVGVLGVAFLAVKGTMDAVFEAENIKQVSTQFDMLTRRAGLYGETLKRALSEASGGWADDTELMKAANEAMVKLETGVEKLPQLMLLARQATSVMGGSMIENFNSINQAIATGSTRMLRHLGIMVDQKKAYEAYARSIGVTVDSLSLAGRQQAVMNAVLEKGGEMFKGINPNIKENTSLWQQTKVTLKEVGETALLAFDRIAGPLVKTELKGLSAIAKDVKRWVTSMFGTGPESSAAQADRLREKVQGLKAELIDIDQRKNKGIFLAEDKLRAMEINTQLGLYNKQLEKSTAEVKAHTAEEEKAAEKRKEIEKSAGAGKTDPTAVAKQRAQVMRELASLDEQITKEQLRRMTSVAEATRLYNQERLEDGKRVDAQIAEVQAKEKQGMITHAQATQEIIRLNKLKDLRMRQDDDQLRQYQERALDQYVRKSQNAFDGVGRAFAAQAQKSKMELADWGANGQKVVSSFSSHATSALQAWGAGTKTAAQAASGFFAGMVGDMATHYGQMLLLTSIWPPNPLGIAAGAALIALGGLLGSLASGGGGASAASVGGGGGGGYASGADMSTPSQAAGQAAQKNSVNLIIQGHMLTDDRTARWIVDQVRSASDATDFTIRSVNGGFN